MATERRLSDHFWSAEFACRHCGRLPWYGIDPNLLERLEQLRLVVGPIPVVSGWRCTAHNRRIGGAGRSMHLEGRAVDVPVGLVTVDQARAHHFSGIGRRGGSAVHLDVRWQLHVTEWSYG